MAVYVFQWDTPFNVSVQPVFRVVDVKSISMNVHHHHATMAEFVQIYHKATDANALLDIQEKIAKMKKAHAKLIHAQHEPCAKMKLDMAISLVFAEVDTLELIVMLLLILAQRTAIHVEMVHLVSH